MGVTAVPQGEGEQLIIMEQVTDGTEDSETTTNDETESQWSD